MSEQLPTLRVPIMDFLSQALKGTKLKGEIWSFDCYEFSVKIKLGDVELDFEVPYTAIEYPEDTEDFDAWGPVTVVLS